MGEVGYEIDSAMAMVELRSVGVSVLVDVSPDFALWCSLTRAAWRALDGMSVVTYHRT